MEVWVMSSAPQHQRRSDPRQHLEFGMEIRTHERNGPLALILVPSSSLSHSTGVTGRNLLKSIAWDVQDGIHILIHTSVEIRNNFRETNISSIQR